jgi:hypothetical protein
MKRVLLMFLALTALVPALAPAAEPHARVWLADRSPLTVRGSGFKAHEKVVVTLTVDGRFTRTKDATAAGALTATWTDATVKSGCFSVSIRAVGNHGSVATYKSAARECAPPPPPPGP